MTKDIVAELDEVLAQVEFWRNAGKEPDYFTITPARVQRARDAIDALCKAQIYWFEKARDARAEALEEAARMCEADADLFDAQVANAMEACASAVRALKDAP